MRPLLLAGLASLDYTVVLAQSPPRLDHVVMVVAELDSAEARLAPLGFRIKPGRLHPDNLLNAHVKFADGTELELRRVGRLSSRSPVSGSVF